MRTSPARTLMWTVVATAGLLAVAALYLFNPAESRLFPPCPFHALTGWQCPGCGSLRAAHCLLHGDLIAAFRLNPLMLLFSPFVTYGLLAGLWNTTFTKPLPVVRLPARWIWAILALIILHGIARNLPFMLFNLPAS